MAELPMDKPKSANVDVVVMRDYWDADGVRHLAAWEEPTNQVEIDPATGKSRIKMIKHKGAVISVPRAEAKKGIEAGYFKADI